jgi:hypothetical protein
VGVPLVIFIKNINDTLIVAACHEQVDDIVFLNVQRGKVGKGVITGLTDVGIQNIFQNHGVG